MKLSIRTLLNDEILDPLFSLNQYSLYGSPPFQNKEEWLSIVRNRKGVTCQAAFEDETPVSIAVSTAMTQNVRSGLYPAAGIWGVATHPSARRKGYCRKTIQFLLKAERESGKVFSNLYPFRESFYENLGYVTYPMIKKVEFSPQSLAPFLRMSIPGEVQIQLIGDAYDTYRQYLTDMRVTQHGMAFFDYGDPASANRNTLWVALAREGDRIEGLMLYRLVGEEPTKFQFLAPRFYYKTAAGRALLLEWIARHIDQAEKVEMWLPPYEFPETWMADLQIKFWSPVRAAMSRVLDVEKMGGMQVGPGSFTARISDPHCPWNEGIWNFESLEDRLKVSPAGQAQCDLTIQGLSALVSGIHDPADFAFRGWSNADETTQIVQRVMFPSRIPYLHENF